MEFRAKQHQTSDAECTGRAGGTPRASSRASRERPPAAKTQPEFEAYKAAMALTDPAALEKAADDFATKFPDSELRTMLYYRARCNATSRPTMPTR